MTTLPTYVGAGTAVSSTGTAVSCAVPAGHQTGDYMLFVTEASGNSAVIAAPAGWNEIWDSRDVNTIAGSRIRVYERFATSSSMPNVSSTTGSDHIQGRVHVWRGVRPSPNQINAQADDVKGPNGSGSASTTCTMPSVTTTVPNCKIVWISSRPDDSASTTHFGTPSNANTINEDSTQETGTTDGNGGGFVVAYGDMVSAGVVGTTTMTKTASTTECRLTLALEPIPDVLHAYIGVGMQ